MSACMCINISENTEAIVKSSYSKSLLCVREALELLKRDFVALKSLGESLKLVSLIEEPLASIDLI